MAVPVAVDPARVIAAVGVEAVGPERGGTVRPSGVRSAVPGRRESREPATAVPRGPETAADVRSPADGIAARSDGTAGAADVREGPAARRRARDSVDAAAGRAARGPPGARSRGAVVDRPAPRRGVRTRAGPVIELASAHPFGGSATSVAHARAVAPIRAARD